MHAHFWHKLLFLRTAGITYCSRMTGRYSRKRAWWQSRRGIYHSYPSATWLKTSRRQDSRSSGLHSRTTAQRQAHASIHCCCCSVVIMCQCHGVGAPYGNVKTVAIFGEALWKSRPDPADRFGGGTDDFNLQFQPPLFSCNTIRRPWHSKNCYPDIQN